MWNWHDTAYFALIKVALIFMSLVSAFVSDNLE